MNRPEHLRAAGFACGCSFLYMSEFAEVELGMVRLVLP
jgi:hypothetical protein